MTVRNVTEGTLALVVLLVLALIGWQTTVLTGDITNVKAAMVTQHDLAETAKAWAANKDADVGRGAITLANNVTPATSDPGKEPPVAPQGPAGSAARSGEPDGTGPLKILSDDLWKMKQELAGVQASADYYKKQLADVQAKLDANIEATRIARVDLGHIIKNDSSGTPIVAIREMTQNPEFKDEFRRAVNEVVEPRLVPAPLGTIRIVNRMGTSQYLEVNGVGRWIGPLGALDVVVPAGVATTRLSGYEPAKSWRLDAGNGYLQSVIIEPQPIYTPIIYY